MDRWLAILGLLALTSVVCSVQKKIPHSLTTVSITPNATTVPASTTASSNSSSTKTVAPTSSPSKNSSSVVPTSSTHSPSKTVAPSSTTHLPSKTVTPSSTKTPHVTPTPSPVRPPTVPQYTLLDAKSGNSCIVMNASMDFIVGYNISKVSGNQTKGQPKYLHLNLTNATVNTNNSYCNKTTGVKGDWTALLQLEWPCMKEECHVNFTFDASTNDTARQWVLSTTTVSIPGDLFADGTHPINGTQLEGTSYEVMDQKLDYQRSYFCNSARNATTSITNGSFADFYNMTITVSHFQVQAFEFNEAVKYGFDQFASCSADSQGNKIVPIAVGAALAGLVVIVLIAYIIGRLRSRKQSSYEALS